MRTILGIDPGTTYMGVAVLTDRQLIASGVHTLRNGERPYDVVGQARKVLLAAIARYRPDIVAIEKPLRPWTKRVALLTVIVEEFRARSRELGIRVALLLPHEVRFTVVGDPRATKVQVAHALVAQGFSELADRVPKVPKRAALGIAPRDRYWLHVFDALAVAVAAGKAPGPTVGAVLVPDELRRICLVPPNSLRIQAQDPTKADRPCTRRSGAGHELL